jgi:hypothetical protein
MGPGPANAAVADAPAWRLSSGGPRFLPRPPRIGSGPVPEDLQIAASASPRAAARADGGTVGVCPGITLGRVMWFLS